ncbi:MAG: DUF362 domain-containing protein [Chloroflexota bacterium]
MPTSRVALIQGDDRYSNTRAALAALGEAVSLAGKQRIVVKPNFVTTNRPLAATHADAVRAVLDYLVERGAARITLAEGPAMGSFRQGLEHFGYTAWLGRYPVDLVDLNDDEGVPVPAYDSRLGPITLRVARTVLESDLRISVSPPKTHDAVNVTLALKNYAVGSLVRGQKCAIHQGCAGINLNLYKLAAHVAPHLAILDGFEAMEGNGPTQGTAVDWRIAIASTDFLAADGLACHLMGFDLDEIGYLHYCQRMGLGQGRIEDMEIVGNVAPEAVARRFRPHRSYRELLEWQIVDVERYL